MVIFHSASGLLSVTSRKKKKWCCMTPNTIKTVVMEGLQQPPSKVAEWVRLRELATIWKVFQTHSNHACCPNQAWNWKHLAKLTYASCSLQLCGIIDGGYFQPSWGSFVSQQQIPITEYCRAMETQTQRGDVHCFKPREGQVKHGLGDFHSSAHSHSLYTGTSDFVCFLGRWQMIIF